MSTLDLSVFKNEVIANCSNGDHATCAAIYRLVVALKYYSTLDVKKNKNDRETFLSFMDTYKQIVDDNNHFMAFHSNQLNEICAVLMDGGKCTMKDCTASQRHFGSEKNLNIADDHTVNFYVNLMDSLHFIICHCYDCGMRIKQSQNEAKQNEDDYKSVFDAEFARINVIIRKSDLETEPFERISSTNNSKFTISESDKDDTTFLDELYKHLRSESMEIEKLNAFIAEEQYDSDSIKTDVLHFGNIQTCKQSILRFIKSIKVQSDTFSVGLRFYYWPYYKNKNEITENGWNNEHDHGGYKVSELFVKAKFGSFKEEITHYKDFEISMYNQASIKANKFLESAAIKMMSVKYADPNDKEMFLHYDIAFGALVSFYHILSLIFYTDFTKLSSAFSATFRKIHNFETLKSIKRRNALYYHMSKYLRELVECFGQCSFGDKWEKFDYGGDDVTKPLDALKGPFYCGMNFKMSVGSFAMRLNSPSSTSRTFEVAVKFSGPNGVVLTFKNGRTYEWQYQYLRAIDCSAISRFKEEDECLFFGGFYRIKVINLRIIATRENMRMFVSAFLYFDAVLTGASLRNVTKRKNDFIIMDNLINLKLGKESSIKLPSFILDCFDAFIANKRQITFNVSCLEKDGDYRINNLFFHSLDKREPDEEYQRDDEDFNNLVRSETFAVFPNVQSLVIDTEWGYKFCFSMEALLNEIKETNLNEIIVKSTEWVDHCWIKSVWNSHKGMLTKQYAEQGFEIKMQEVVNSEKHKYNDNNYNLTITKF